MSKKSLAIMIIVVYSLFVCNACGEKNNFSTVNKKNVNDKITIDETANNDENRRCLGIISGLKETEYIITSFERTPEEEMNKKTFDIYTYISFEANQLDNFLKETEEDNF